MGNGFNPALRALDNAHIRPQQFIDQLIDGNLLLLGQSRQEIVDIGFQINREKKLRIGAVKLAALCRRKVVMVFHIVISL